MKTKIVTTVFVLFALATLHAQEYKVSKSTGNLVIKEVNNVQIEGYSGNEIVFTSLNYSRDRDKRSEGLKAINSMGLDDNTGFGISVVEKGTDVEVYQLKNMGGPKLSIKVPKGVKIIYSHSSPHGSSLRLRNIENEIDISTVHNAVYLENVTGPMSVRTVHGDIEANFSAGIKSPVLIKSTHGPVDVTVPESTKASLSMATKYGEIFVDPSLKVEVESRGDWKVYGSNNVNGKMNGGGLSFELASTHNSIYLRKK